MKLDYLILALKNLEHRGIRSWLTLLGIFIGVTAVVSLISLGAGLQAAVSAQFGISSTQVITVQAGGINAYGVPGSGAADKLTIDDAEAIERLSSVEIAIPRIISSVKIEFNDIVDFGMVSSVPDGDGRKFSYEVLDIEAETGRMLKDDDISKVLLGYNFGRDDGIFEKAIVPGKSVLIQDQRFKVVGILEKTGSIMFDEIVMINEAPLRDLLDYGDDVDLIGVKARSEDVMDRAKEDVEKLMRKRRDVEVGEEDFEVSTPEAMMETVNNILGGVQAFIIIVASISILVGALGIVNTMTTSVLERRKEIGIMKAIGAKNSQVFMQFFFESGMLGFIGGLVGVVFGTLIGIAGIMGINNFLGAELSPIIDFVLIGGALVGSFVIGAVAGIVPAMSAAKQNPVEALRG
ncbi:ABC transporter permease [Candidatus Pacearchaeota archaeon]|nr:ABC transporter permease [Candidatus Pacearchaeota archaeon]